MKIIVLTGSPRKNGNSAILSDNFIKGATEAGHEIFRFDSAFKNVHPCIACEKCQTEKSCVFKDDFETVKQHILDADVIVFASPVYYFGMSAQLKSVIDRFYAINDKLMQPKKSILLLTLADTEASTAEPVISHYKSTVNYLKWKDIGQIIAYNLWEAGAINQTSYLAQAYKLGKNL